MKTSEAIGEIEKFLFEQLSVSRIKIRGGWYGTITVPADIIVFHNQETDVSTVVVAVGNLNIVIEAGEDNETGVTLVAQTASGSEDK